jgi:hypothetical protein
MIVRPDGESSAIWLATDLLAWKRFVGDDSAQEGDTSRDDTTIQPAET